MNLNIVADENMEGVAESMGELGTVRLVNGRSLQQRDLQEADVLLVRSVTAINQALLEATPIRFVGTATSGFDHVDIAYLHRHQIAFAHAPGANANSVVEYVLAAIAAVDDKLEQLFSGGTVGIIGYGNIGKLLAARLSSLGLRYRIYDPWLAPEQLATPASLNEVLQCDVVSVHAELTNKLPWASYHLLGEAELSRLGATSLLINASRGAIVDNIALEEQLRTSSELAVVLDVWEEEPRVSESLLSRVKLGTAHIAGYSLDGKLLATRMLKQALLDHLSKPALSENGNAVDGQPLIQLPDSSTQADCLRTLLRYNYNIGLDDQLLRKAVVGQNDNGVAASFDRLRKGYRPRRELLGTAVDATQKSAAEKRIIEAMGCRLVNPSTGCL